MVAVDRPGSLPFDADRLARRLVATGPTHRWTSPFAPSLGADLPTSTAGDVARAAERARVAQPGWARRSFEERAEVLLRFHDRLLDRLRGLRRPGAVRRRQGSSHGRRGGAARGAQRPLLRGDGRALPQEPPRSGPAAGPDPDRSALPAQGPGRRHRPVELSADHGHLGRAGGLDGRQRGAPQAGRPDPVQRPGGRRSAVRVRTAGRSLDRRQRRGGHGRPGVDLDGGLRLLHGIDADREDRGRSVRRATDRLLARAGRQESAAGAGRRGRRSSRRRRGPGLLLQRRSAVSVRRTAVRRRVRARRLHGRLRGPDPLAATGHLHGLSRPDGRPDERRPTRTGRTTRRRCARRTELSC